MSLSKIAKLTLVCVIVLVMGLVSVGHAAKVPTIGYVTANMTATSQVRTTNAFVAQGKAKGWKVITADARGSWP